MHDVSGSQKTAIFAAIVFVLFGSYFSYALFLTGQPSNFPLVKFVAAKDGEDDGDDDGGDDGDSNDDNDDNDDNGGSSKSEKEKKKKEEERKRESDKKAAERARESARRASNGSDDNNDDMDSEDENDDMDGDDDKGNSMDDDTENGDDNGMYKDRAKTMERLNEKIAKAEEKILEKQAEGVDVTAALAALAIAKSKVGDVNASFATKDFEEIKSLSKETERLAQSARGKVLHESEKVAKDTAKVDKRIAKTKAKISALESAGGDGSTFRSRLSEIESTWSDVKARIAAGGDGLLAALSEVDTVERRVKSLKNAVENALLAMGVSDEDEFESEHATEVEDASDDLDDLAELEDETESEHGVIKQFTKTHRDEATKATALIERYNSRAGVTRQLLGDDRKSLEDLQTVVDGNDARIAAMEQAVSTVEDKELATLMNERLAELKAQNAKLQNFINTQPFTNGLFGWVLNLF